MKKQNEKLANAKRTFTKDSKVKENKIIPPTNIIIGKVVDLSDVIGWK